MSLIGKGALIEGTLQVKGDVRIDGKVIGEVEVEGTLITTNDGILEGDIRASKLVIEDGAVFSGKCDTSLQPTGSPRSGKSSEAKQPARPAPVTNPANGHPMQPVS